MVRAHIRVSKMFPKELDCGMQLISKLLQRQELGYQPEDFFFSFCDYLGFLSSEIITKIKIGIHVYWRVV